MGKSRYLLSAIEKTSTTAPVSFYYLGDYGEPLGANAASVEVSPFWGADRNALKIFYYVDVIFEPLAPTKESITFSYWIDGEEGDKRTALIDVDSSAAQGYNRWRARVNLGFIGHELSISLSTTGSGSNHWWRVHSIIYGWKRHGSISQ